MEATWNLKDLKKSKSDKWIGGVCGWFGSSTPIPSWLWRVGFLVTFLAVGVGFLAYVLLWAFMPAGTSES